jgi:hypothetical protein
VQFYDRKWNKAPNVQVSFWILFRQPPNLHLTYYFQAFLLSTMNVCLAFVIEAMCWSAMSK